MHFMAQRPPAEDDAIPLFELRDLHYAYPDATPALRGINLRIRQGDRIALVGRNGSGKSTLIRHLGGLAPVQQGACRFQGEDLTPAHLPELRRRVGILFQDPDDHLFCSTLEEDVAFGPRNQGRSEAEVQRVVREQLEAVGLARLRAKPAHLLSYGQKKRAALAAILAMEPEVLLLDEPAANLDPRQEAIFRRILAAFQGTLIVIEHDLLFLYALCQRAVVLADGAIHHDFALRDLVAQPQALRDHGLDFTFRFTCCGRHHPVIGVHRHHHPTHEHGPDGGHLPPTGEAQPLIELQHYSFRYPDRTAALTDLNLSLFPGQTVALVGENGAGKSTLAACLLGLQRGQGALLLDGRPVDSATVATLRRRVGMVFQQAADQLFCASCFEEVAFAPQQLGLPAGEISRRVTEALALVGLEGCAERVPLHLSGGERKRLAIAAGLSLAPDLLILDEPTAGLDPDSEQLLLDLLARLPMAKVLITHDLFFIRSLTSRTVVLHQGRIVRDYPTAEFLADDHLQMVNGLDYTYKDSCIAEIRDLQQAGGSGEAGEDDGHSGGWTR